jgi:hypothetical protein
MEPDRSTKSPAELAGQTRKLESWSTPALRMAAASAAQADQGGIHFDGAGFIS